MTTSQLSKSNVEQQLLSKEAIKLPPRHRLDLLLKVSRYPVVHKRTSAESQIKEMLDFYNLCCIMLTQFFPNSEAENNFILLSFMASHENAKSIMNGKFMESFKLLRDYEELENKITALQTLFHQYKDYYPELYQSYNLEELSVERISDIIQKTKQQINANPQLIEEALKRWDLLS